MKCFTLHVMNLKYMKVSLFEISYKKKNELFHDILIHWDAPVVWETSPYHDACATMLHCLHSVLWLEFSVWGSSDKLSAAPRPKKNNHASSVHKILSHFSLGQSMCSLAHVNLVLSSLLQIDWFINPSLCLLNDDSGLCINSMQKRMLFAGFTAAKKTIIQNWFTPHMCGKTYWIHSLLQIVTYECTTARINGAKPLTIDAWQCFLSDIRDCIKEWLLLFLLSFPPSLPFDWTLRYWVCVCCFVIFFMLCMKNKKCW